MRKHWYPIIGLLALTILPACKGTQVICTQQFVIVSLEVTGPQLNDWFTIREFNKDTIRITNNVFMSRYPVLDDSWQSVLENHGETFTFYGIYNEQVVVKEPFFITADQCHIIKVSGVDSTGF